jgi:hypothetical protein
MVDLGKVLIVDKESVNGQFRKSVNGRLRKSVNGRLGKVLMID